MKKKYKLLLMMLFAIIVMGTLASCKKDKDEDPTTVAATTALPEATTPAETPAGSTTPAEQPSGATEVKPDELSYSTKIYRPEVFSAEFTFPEEATVVEKEAAMIADTPEYLLYVFKMDTYNGGAVFNEMDLLALLNDPDDRVIAKDMLRLRDFEILDDQKIVVYENLNNMRAVYCPMTKMEFMDESEQSYNGDGFTMIYGKKDTIGVYVVIGLMKDYDRKKSDEESRKTEDMLRVCAMSLKTDSEEEAEYEIFSDSMPDETEMIAAYKKDAVTSVRKSSDGIYLFLDEAETEYILIRHQNMLGNVSLTDQMENLMSELRKKDGITLSDVTGIEGRYNYKTVTMDLSGEMKETLCITVDDNGSLWSVDLYTTATHSEAGLNVLFDILWTLKEN
ncbi:MAG: hypothetical protein IKX10_08095 [Lachnospiraceae bacterium]|nr:hypothetical protein [Lachnospiraceae bacterium]